METPATGEKAIGRRSGLPGNLLLHDIYSSIAARKALRLL